MSQSKEDVPLRQLQETMCYIDALRDKIEIVRFDSLFPTKLWPFLNSITTSLPPFDDNGEYINYLQYCQLLWIEINLLKSQFFSGKIHSSEENKSANRLLVTLYEDLKRIKMTRTEKTLTMYKEYLQGDSNLTSNEIATFPRILRAAMRLDLTLKETISLEYAVTSQCMALPIPLSSMNFLAESSTTGFVMNYAELTAKEVVHFFEEKRLHIQQGFLDMDSEFRSFLNNGLKTAPEILKALLCCEISATEFLKIDNTVMSDVLKEEPDFALLPSLDIDINEGDSGENEDEELIKGDIMDFIAGQIEETRLESNLQEEKEKETSKSLESNKDTGDTFSAYSTDIEYLNDQFTLMSAVIKKRFAEMEEHQDRKTNHYMDPKKEEALVRSQIREQKGIEKMMRAKCARRLALTKNKGNWLPRLEILSERSKLTEFEKEVLIISVGGVVSSEIRKATGEKFRKFSEKKFEIGILLWVLCPSLEEQMKARSYFYKSGTLVKEGIIHLGSSTPWSRGAGDLMSNLVEIDRRMLDFLAGIDNEMNEIVEGSNLYVPSIEIDNVILPSDTKKLILETVHNFEAFKACKERLGLGGVTNYGNGLVLLFYGQSGTGKTMTANAVATQLKKRILLINFGSLQDKTGDKIRFIFREAKINNAILFFDECEAMFESRDKTVGGDQAAMLTAIERHEGMIIMATNRAYDLDEAMYRRISLSVEFSQPDPQLREKIWKTHLPEKMSLSADVDLAELSLHYELSGGFIKNAISAALSRAVARDNETPLVCMDDLVAGAKLQLRGCMQMSDFDCRVIPTLSLNDLVLPANAVETLQKIINFDKSQKILYQQWGFEKKQNQNAIVALFHGESGCGKTAAAEAIGSETGKALLVINVATLLSKNFHRSQTFQNIFKEAKSSDAILVFEGIDALFSEQCSSLDVGVLMHHIQSFFGIVILLTRRVGGLGSSFIRQFKFVIEFKMPPVAARSIMWRKAIPEQVPLAKDVDFKILAERFILSGGRIREAAFAACAKSALVSPLSPVPFALLKESAVEIEKIANASNPQQSMYY